MITAEFDYCKILETNLVSISVYGSQYERSAEQAKQYCKKGRIQDGLIIGRDRLILRDARVPGDLHGID